jgi:hypothetical protein
MCRRGEWQSPRLFLSAHCLISACAEFALPAHRLIVSALEASDSAERNLSIKPTRRPS